MYTPTRRVASFALILSAASLARPVAGQPDAVLPPTTRAPRLVLANSRPHAPVRALAFSPDGSALYVAGFDKQVRRYKLVGGDFVADRSFHVPIGPGIGGVLNALAVSPDGKWVAAAGRAPIRGEVWVGADDGVFEDYRFDPEDVRGDAGIVYLIDPNNPNGGKAIRGQLSEVRALAFASPSPAGGDVLVTTGIERNEKGAEVGAMHVFDVKTGKQLAKRLDLPATVIPPGLAAWGSGVGSKELRVAVAWDRADEKPGKLLVWNAPGATGATTVPYDDREYNSTLAVRYAKDGSVAELVTGGFDPRKGAGGLTVRRADGTAKENIAIVGKAGDKDYYLPLGVAALNVKGTDALAVLSRIVPFKRGEGTRHELRLIAAGAGAPVALAGLDEDDTPVLAASPDGRFVAVGGFLDNRVEIYSADALAGNKGRLRQELSGAEGGFAKVAFLTGEKLWLGKPADSPEKGGVILDLNAKVRTAVPRGAKEELKLDDPGAPAPKIVPGNLAKNQPWRVVATIAGAEKTITLPEGAVATASALLPAGAAWDKDLGAIVAVAHVHDRTRTVRLTLYGPDGKALYELGGPTLPVRSLAFSKARALLAGAGDDGTVAVWSLKNVSRPVPVIEGLLVTTRDNKVVVASVQENSPAKGKFAAGDVIESVTDAKGNVRAVKIAAEFVLLVRALKPGADANVMVNKRAVAVRVGTATGFRLPLFDLWVDPVANAGRHAWVGWTPSGPYDASGPDGEARIGWLTATGDPSRPVTVVGAEQYRRLFRWPDFIRRLLETADYTIAYNPPDPPKLRAAFPAAFNLANGRLVTREKIDATVTLADADRARDTSVSELRWQVVGPDGTSDWVPVSFAGGQVTLDLTDRVWKRGTYTVRAKLFLTPDPAPEALPLAEAAATVEYIPPEPKFGVTVGGNAAAPDSIIAAKKDAVEVAATVDPKSDPANVVVKVSWTGGGEPVELTRNTGGTFGPLKIDLKADETAIRVTATNRGATAPEESSAVEVRVRKPVKIPPPTVALGVLTAHDFRPTLTEPYAVSTDKVVVSARVTDTNPITAFEWKVGDGPWEAGKLEADPETKALVQTRTIDLSEYKKKAKKDERDDLVVAVEVRATSKAEQTAARSVTIKYDPLPDVSMTIPAAEVTAPELNLSGGLKVLSKRRVAVRLLVTSPRTGQTREFAPTVNAAQTAWSAGVTLFPHENQLGYVVRYDDNRKELRRTGLVEVRYVRPPVVLGGSPLEIGRGASGKMTLAVASSSEPAPQLLVQGNVVAARTTKKPVRVFGAPLWVLSAEGVPADPTDRKKAVDVVVRNGERDSAAVPVSVRAEELVEVAAPTLVLTYPGGTIPPDRPLPPVSSPNFTFDVHLKSAAPLTRVDVLHGAAPQAQLDRISTVSARDAVAGGGGFELSARVSVRLRPGADNYIRVEAVNGGKPVSYGFFATYTPPPVEVVIDSIKEPNGPEVAVTPDNAHRLQVGQGIVEVRGRVTWTHDDDPVARAANLSVVFVANGVSHLPVLVSSVLPGESRVRRFSGRVYLNSPTLNPLGLGETRVRAELRTGRRPVPQVGAERAAVTVASKTPFTRQRLHVLILGVQVPDEEQGKLVRRVIESIGGTIPANDPNFIRGEFQRKGFEYARLYQPQLDYTGAGHLNYLLEQVHANIQQRARNPGDAWVNDVVLLYYQGADWQDEKSGRWLLHTATTMNDPGNPNAAANAIRPDDLLPVPGMLVAVVNVTGAEMKGDPLATDLPYLRYAWPKSGEAVNLLGAIDKAVRDQRTVEEMRRSVDADLQEKLDRGRRIGFLPDVVLARVMGLKGLGPKP